MSSRSIAAASSKLAAIRTTRSMITSTSIAPQSLRRHPPRRDGRFVTEQRRGPGWSASGVRDS